MNKLLVALIVCLEVSVSVTFAEGSAHGRALRLFSHGNNSGEEECEDLHDKCEGWAEAGECTGSYSEMMAKKCPKSCGTCDKQASSEPVLPEDMEAEEDKITREEESALVLPEDDKDSVAKEETGLAGPPDADAETQEASEACEDTHPKCEPWAKAGSCEGDYKAIVTQRCPKSCGLCEDGLGALAADKDDPEEEAGSGAMEHDIVSNEEEEEEDEGGAEEEEEEEDSKKLEHRLEEVVEDEDKDEEESIILTSEKDVGEGEEPTEVTAERIQIAQMLMDRASATLALSHAYESVDDASKQIDAAKAEVSKFLSTHTNESEKASATLLEADLEHLIEFSDGALKSAIGTSSMVGALGAKGIGAAPAASETKDIVVNEDEKEEEEVVIPEEKEDDEVEEDGATVEDKQSKVEAQDSAKDEQESEDTVDCVDQNAKCNSWAANGECDGDFKDVMLDKCPKACGVCEPLSNARSLVERDSIILSEEEECEDRKGTEKCQKWADSGECTGDYADKMKEFCAKTCGVCR